MFVVGDGSRYAVVARNRAECEGLCTVYKRLWYVCFVPSFETFGLGGMNVGVGECCYLLAETLFLSPGGSVLVFWRKRFSSMTASPVKTDSLCLLFPKGSGGVQLIQPKGGTSSCLRVGDNLDLMRQARHS